VLCGDGERHSGEEREQPRAQEHLPQLRHRAPPQLLVLITLLASSPASSMTRLCGRAMVVWSLFGVAQQPARDSYK
jgi:hypothetical protein